MAFTKEVENDLIEVIGNLKIIEIRTRTTVKEDGVVISENLHRRPIACGDLDASNNLKPTDLSAQPASVVAICNAAWTSDAKASWKAKLIADKPSE